MTKPVGRSPSPSILDVLVIGGGLSGILVAQGVHQRFRSLSSTMPSGAPEGAPSTSSTLQWKLLEARPVLGGRLANDRWTGLVDMGGAWIWPQHQPRLRAILMKKSSAPTTWWSSPRGPDDPFYQLLVDEVETFPQPDDPSSTRVVGGAVRIIESLVKMLPQDRIILNSPVVSCQQVLLSSSSSSGDDNHHHHHHHHHHPPTMGEGETSGASQVVVRVDTKGGDSYWARKVVWAVPPRLLSQHVTFNPPLSTAKQSACQNSHTWMAGVTKVALLYRHRFWSPESSNMGLPRGSGGPAFQVYDGSTHDGRVPALTFFAWVPPHDTAAQRDDDDVLARQVARQMGRVWESYWGRSDYAQQAMEYTQAAVQRWPLQEYISEDPQPDLIHPHPPPIPALSTPEWNDTLFFAGSETDLESPGVMEGAVGAAQRVLKQLQAFWPASTSSTASSSLSSNQVEVDL